MEARVRQLVPASLIRVRCFLGKRARMKVRPWAGRAEVLDVLHDALLARREDEDFWKDLAGLLETLTADMHRRMQVPAVDNEVLDPGQHAALLAEIRSGLEVRAAGRGGFRRLASALSVPACGLLLVLGGAVTAGCEGDQSIVGGPDVGTDPVVDSSEPDPDPDPDPDLEPDACEHAGMSLDGILETCVPDDEGREYYRTCIEGLHSSWHGGLRDLFECYDCWEVLDRLHCLNGGWDFCSEPGRAGEYDLETLLDNCFVGLYIGVRFD